MKREIRFLKKKNLNIVREEGRVIEGDSRQKVDPDEYH
jgi:hypothetical protein